MVDYQRQDVEILTTTNAYQGFYTLKQITLRHKLFAGGWSQPINRELVEHIPAVAVLLYDVQLDSVVMIEQFRIGALDHPQGPWQLELVGGLIDTNETPQQVAARECQEEAGLTVSANDLLPVANYLVTPGGSNEHLAIYCAQVDARQAGGIYGVVTENEDIRVVVYSRQTLWQAMQQLNSSETIQQDKKDDRSSKPNITNAATIIALQWLQLNYQQLQEKWQ